MVTMHKINSNHSGFSTQSDNTLLAVNGFFGKIIWNLACAKSLHHYLVAPSATHIFQSSSVLRLLVQNCFIKSAKKWQRSERLRKKHLTGYNLHLHEFNSHIFVWISFIITLFRYNNIYLKFSETWRGKWGLETRKRAGAKTRSSKQPQGFTRHLIKSLLPMHLFFFKLHCIPHNLFPFIENPN